VCTKCVKCKSCGATTPGKGWDAQWSHDFSLCHDCGKLFDKGNFCPVCNRCYDDDDYESKMMQCGKCERWVHAKCESLSDTPCADEMYEILSSLPESVVYTCVRCTESRPAEWSVALAAELQAGLQLVASALAASRVSASLHRHRQSSKAASEAQSGTPAGAADSPVATDTERQDLPTDLEGVKRKLERGAYNSLTGFCDDVTRVLQCDADVTQPEVKRAAATLKGLFTRQMEKVFPWFDIRGSRFWDQNRTQDILPAHASGLLPNAVLPPSADHDYAQWREREGEGAALAAGGAPHSQPPLLKKIVPAPRRKASTDAQDDSGKGNPLGPYLNRNCSRCFLYSKWLLNEAGRLLGIGQDEWTHSNCAVWSAEVFEDDDGSLKNVHAAVWRGKQLRCEHCGRMGATVGCCLPACQANFHFMCARARSCVFQDDKKLYCQRHKDLIRGEVVAEDGFEVLRRVFVDFEGIGLRRKFLSGLEPDKIQMMIGSLTIECLGVLNDLSLYEGKLFPIGYQCTRVYWSTADARRLCVYTCKVLEFRPESTTTDVNSTLIHGENQTITHSP
uniref:[histone H3]-lysine(4) N-methyltransferase n=1 Tax=Petromyzon marinus TaxID=7757 RepID=S4RAI7_PETMA